MYPHLQSHRNCGLFKTNHQHLLFRKQCSAIFRHVVFHGFPRYMFFPCWKPCCVENPRTMRGSNTWSVTTSVPPSGACCWPFTAARRNSTRPMGTARCAENWWSSAGRGIWRMEFLERWGKIGNSVPRKPAQTAVVMTHPSPFWKSTGVIEWILVMMFWWTEFIGFI